MTTELVCAGVGIAYLASRIYKERKMKAKMADIDLSEYKCNTFYKWIIIVLGVIIALSIYEIIWGFINKSHVHASLGIAMIFMSVAEIYYAYHELRVYYNDRFVIVNGSRLPYKKIKAITPKSVLFLTRGVIETFNGERLTVYRGVMDAIRPYVNNHEK